MNQIEPLRPANAEAIAEFAEETGAEVLRGALRYPSNSGGWQLGDIDLGEHLAYRIGNAPLDKVSRRPCPGRRVTTGDETARTQDGRGL